MATNCLLAYSSKISRLESVRIIRYGDWDTYVRPRWDETNFKSARPISGRMDELLFRQSTRATIHITKQRIEMR